MSEDRVVCVLCGRRGSRAYVILSGTGDGTRDSYICENRAACEKRAAKVPEWCIECNGPCRDES